MREPRSLARSLKPENLHLLSCLLACLLPRNSPVQLQGNKFTGLRLVAPLAPLSAVVVINCVRTTMVFSLASLASLASLISLASLASPASLGSLAQSVTNISFAYICLQLSCIVAGPVTKLTVQSQQNQVSRHLSAYAQCTSYHNKGLDLY